MFSYVEETLGRELREVADGLPVPPLPELPQEPPRRDWRRPLLLVAAAVVLIVTGALAVATLTDGDATPEPAPPAPLTADAPTVPYLLDGRLYVEGERLPGTWWTVRHAGDAWVAHRDDDTWWWGTDTEPIAIPGTVNLEPQLSPAGSLLAVATSANGGEVRLAETRPDGDTIGTLTSAAGVVAVTDEGAVILQDADTQLLWPAPDGETVDLGETAPDQSVQRSTPAGLVVYDGRLDGEQDASYLADVSESGELGRRQSVPVDDVVVSPSGTWLAYGGSWGGESQTIPTVRAESIGSRQRVTFDPPRDGELRALTWEDDALLLAEIYQDGNATGLARCSVREQRCVVVDTE